MTKRFDVHLYCSIITHFWLISRKKWQSLFANEWSIIGNGSKLLSDLIYFTSRELSKIQFNSGNIAKIISDLNPNKAHDHEKISKRMLKICGKSICKPLEYIFWVSLNNESFQKKANIVPIISNL